MLWPGTSPSRIMKAAGQGGYPAADEIDFGRATIPVFAARGRTIGRAIFKYHNGIP
jgi:hypothetical protein